MKNGGFRWKIFCQWWIVHWEVWWPEGTTGAFNVANPRLAVFPKRGGRWNCKEDSYPNSPKPSPTWPYKACSNNPQWVGLYPIVSHFFHNCLNPVLFAYKLYPSYISTFPQGPLGGPRRRPHQIGPGARLLFRDGLWNADAPGGGAWGDEIIVYTVYIVWKWFIDYQQNQVLRG